MKKILIALMFLSIVLPVLANSNSLNVVLRHYDSDYSANITTVANQTTTIDARNETNVTISLVTNVNTSGTIFIGLSYENIAGTAGTTSLIALKFVSIEPSSSISNSLTIATIYIYYTDSELAKSSITESSLKIYYWDTNTWQPITSYINTTGNYIWSNVTYFGRFGVFATIPAITGAGSSVSVGRCPETWICGLWTECTPGETQTRECTDSNECGTTLLKPITQRSCIYPGPIVEEGIEEAPADEIPAEAPPIEEAPAEAIVPAPPVELGTGLIELLLVVIFLISYFILYKKRKKKKK